MQRTRSFLFDSFKAARGDLTPLFATQKSDEHLHKEVRRYIVPGLSHHRHRYLNERLSRSQQRSLFRTNVSLVLQEARRRGNYRVAVAALDVALSETSSAHLAQEFEPTWVKDAVASCQSASELQLLEEVLRRHERHLLNSGTTAGTGGFLLTAAFGRPAAAVAAERGRRLGDEDEDKKGEAAGMESASTLETSLSEGLRQSSNHNDSLVGLAANDANTQSSLKQSFFSSDEARVSVALTQPASITDLAVHGGHGASLWSSPEARAAAGLRRLQQQHRNMTAVPNVSFTRYFLHQGLVRNERELMSLYQAMRSRPEDIAFRVVGGCDDGAEVNLRHGMARQSFTAPRISSSPYAAAVHDLLRRRRGIHRVPWLPTSMGAYTLDTRDSVPQDTVLSNRELLRSLARERLVVYQSLSSMLPVFFLNPQPGEAVLDLCASPGNKTGLILDVMHCGNTAAAVGTPSTASFVSGCVVANEAQASRLHDLQDRLRDISPEVAITRGRGQSFGSPSSSSSSTYDGYYYHNNNNNAQHSLFPEMCVTNAFASMEEDGLYDGVLVDAPCSGEGRMGRDALSWRLWHPGRGLEFFPMQCALLHRAVRLCKTGGRVVYATCTLNPIENEAVVAAVLRACGDSVELVPPPPINRSFSFLPRKESGGGQVSEEEGGEVPLLRLTPGLRTWDVPSSAGGFLHTPGEAYAQGENRSRIIPEMFAASGHPRKLDDSEDDRIGAALHRCCRRVMPHLNGNTDGFFVAMLRKKSRARGLLPAGARNEESASALVLSGASCSTASSLAVSLAGGSNLLMDRGLVRLQASNHIVQKHLGSFFVPPTSTSSTTSTDCRSVLPPTHQESQEQRQGCTSVQSFLDRHGWTAMWCEGEGLRLLSTCAVQLLHRHTTTAQSTPRGAPMSPSTSLVVSSSTSLSSSSAAPATELLDVGVVVVDAHGALTERGAVLLRSGGATSRIVTLPLPYAQLLLANRTLDIGGSLRLMPTFMQEAEFALQPHRGLLSTAAGNASASLPTPSWCLNALAALRHVAEGNAIVSIDVSSSSTESVAAAATAGSQNTGGGSPPASHSNTSWAAPLLQWSWPVRVEVLRPWTSTQDISNGLVRLHLTLPQPSRHRTLALIGRLQGHAHRLCGTLVQQQRAQLQASAAYAPSVTMSNRDLHGAPTQPSQEHRQLFLGGGQVKTAFSADGGSSSASAFATAIPSAVFEL